MMKIALFSPLNPVKTGISDYTEEMLLELAQFFTIDLYIAPDYEPENKSLLSGFQVFTFNPDEFDPADYFGIVYHMGNYYAGHSYIYESLKRFPGIIVLHDYVLQDFYAERFDATGDFSQYKDLQVKAYGKAGEEIAHQFADKSRIPIWESDMAFEFPLNEEIVEYAQGLIVHSEFIAHKIRQKTDKPLAFIPHHGHVLKSFERAAIRKSLNIQSNELLICSAGFINKNKRYDRVLAALEELPELPFKYLISGKDRGHLLKNYLSGKEDYVIRRDHLPIHELEGIIAASDICINLRYPTMGESSGSLLRMMGYSKPTLVTNYGSYAEFPNYCVIKIDPDINEKEMIKRSVSALTKDEDFRISLGKEAGDYVARECGIKKCAGEYTAFINNVCSDNGRIKSV